MTKAAASGVRDGGQHVHHGLLVLGAQPGSGSLAKPPGAASSSRRAMRTVCSRWRVVGRDVLARVQQRAQVVGGGVRAERVGGAALHRRVGVLQRGAARAACSGASHAGVSARMRIAWTRTSRLRSDRPLRTAPASSSAPEAVQHPQGVGGLRGILRRRQRRLQRLDGRLTGHVGQAVGGQHAHGQVRVGQGVHELLGRELAIRSGILAAGALPSARGRRCARSGRAACRGRGDAGRPRSGR